MRAHIVDIRYHHNSLEHQSFGQPAFSVNISSGLEIRMEMVQTHQDSMFPGFGNLSASLLEDIFNDALERYRISRYEAANAMPVKFNLPEKKEQVPAPTKRSLILETA